MYRNVWQILSVSTASTFAKSPFSSSFVWSFLSPRLLPVVKEVPWSRCEVWRKGLKWAPPVLPSKSISYSGKRTPPIFQCFSMVLLVFHGFSMVFQWKEDLVGAFNSYSSQAFSRSVGPCQAVEIMFSRGLVRPRQVSHPMVIDPSLGWLGWLATVGRCR